MGQHWYKKDGTPMYTVVGKNGKERDTNLGDAKKLDLLPSVTTILQQINKPFLNSWREGQVLNSVLDFPYNKNMSEDDWKASIIKLSKQSTEASAKRGSEIHDCLEKYFLTGKKPRLKVDKSIVAPVVEFIHSEFPEVEWEPELSFGYNGYAGKSDLISRKTRNIVMDFKTKSALDLSKVTGYPEHIMQLAAYREGLAIPDAECYNLFISTEKPGEFKLVKWSEEDLRRSYKMFLNLLEFWYLSVKWELKND